MKKSDMKVMRFESADTIATNLQNKLKQES